MCRIQAKSFPGHAWSARASGVGLCLLLDGRFVNDSFIVVIFFATFLSSEKPNGYCQDNTDAKDAG